MSTFYGAAGASGGERGGQRCKLRTNDCIHDGSQRVTSPPERGTFPKPSLFHIDATLPADFLHFQIKFGILYSLEVVAMATLA